MFETCIGVIVRNIIVCFLFYEKFYFVSLVTMNVAVFWCDVVQSASCVMSFPKCILLTSSILLGHHVSYLDKGDNRVLRNVDVQLPVYTL